MTFIVPPALSECPRISNFYKLCEVNLHLGVRLDTSAVRSVCLRDAGVHTARARARAALSSHARERAHARAREINTPRRRVMTPTSRAACWLTRARTTLRLITLW